ncbi:MAG: serine dehydratase subunit alpha family protein [Muribaculaceae bacterium]|nr:serine dehydratase subunit alpha family protein [Muribaculaceae bacterium]
MLNKEIRDEIISLINREVVPALGCTEPAAVALCVAKTSEILGSVPSSIEVSLSGNMLKNAMGVGIPGTGMIGLPIAIALGALVGKSEYGLEVLKDVTPEKVEEGKKFIEEGRINISHMADAPSILHIEVICRDKEGRSAKGVISRSHANFIYLDKDGEVILSESSDKVNPVESVAARDPELNLRLVYDFAVTTPYDEIKFILEARRLNKAAAELAFENDFGHSLGVTIKTKGTSLFGDSPLSHIISYTSAACDARMGGAKIAVMSNSGSGNQGICATMPVVSYAEDINADDEKLARALILSHLTSIYIKQSLGRLSALCGCVVASTGASSGIVYLMGGGYEEVGAAVKNMIANITGMICDGAKPSCSLKISSGVSTALMSAMLAMNDKCVTEAEGIICDDVDRSIRNLTSIGRESMQATDRLVLHIMTNK